MNNETINSKPSTSFINKGLYILAIPISLHYLLMVASRTIDTVMSSHFDVNTLAAISLAFMISGLPLTLINGILYAAVPQYSYLKEKNQPDMIFNLFTEFLIIALVLGVTISILCFYLVPPLLQYMQVAEPLIPLIKTYLLFILPYIVGMVLYNHLYYFSESYGYPVFATLTILLSLIVQAITIYILVFSSLFEQSWGIAGFAFAAVLLVWTKVIILAIILLKYKAFKIIWQNAKNRLNLSIKRMLQNTLKGLPIGLDFLFEWAVMLTLGILIARLGVNEMGAHSIVFNILIMATILSIGFGRASAIMSAQYQDSQTQVKSVIFVAITNLLLYFGLFSLILVLGSSIIIGFYQVDSVLLPIINKLYLPMIFVLLFLSLTNLLAFTLRGLGNFISVFLISVICLGVIFLPLGYVVSSTDYLFPAQGIIGWWYALAFAYFLATVILGLLLYRVVNRLPQQ